MNGYLCYHHNDMDGKAAANEVYKHWLSQGIKPDSSMFIMRGYDEPFNQDDYSGKEVYLVDLSFTDKSIGKLMQICEYASKVTWIDHHKSSIEVIKNEELKGKLSEYSNLEYFVNNDACGALLCFIYFNMRPYKFSSPQSLDYSIEYLGSKSITAMKVTDPDGNTSIDDIPYYMKLIDLWDRWVYGEDLNPVYFNFGCDSRATSLFNYATKDSKTKTYNKNFWGCIDQRYVVTAIISDGKIAKRYNDNMNRTNRQESAYETRIDGWKGLVFNGHGNSTVFGPMANKYDIVCLWNYNGKLGLYQYSLYSTNENVDCSKIAQKFDHNGGGHKGASGFSSKELIFKRKD